MKSWKFGNVGVLTRFNVGDKNSLIKVFFHLKIFIKSKIPNRTDKIYCRGWRGGERKFMIRKS